MKTNLNIATIETDASYNSGLKSLFIRYDDMDTCFYIHNHQTGKYLAETKRSQFWLSYSSAISPSVKPIVFEGYSSASKFILMELHNTLPTNIKVFPIGTLYSGYLQGHLPGDILANEMDRTATKVSNDFKSLFGEMGGYYAIVTP